MAARIKLLLAKQEEAVKLLITGMQKFPDDHELHEQLMPLVLDPRNYVLQDVMQVEEASLKKAAPPTFACLWEQIRSAADWGDALKFLGDYASHCNLKGPEGAGTMQAMRGFLHTGLLQFQKADEVLKGPEGLTSPQSLGLLRAVANHRHRLLQALAREANRASNKDLATIKDRLNAFLRQTTKIAQGKQASQSHRDRRAHEKAAMEAKAAEYVEQQEQRRKVDAPLGGHLGALEHQVERQTEQAEEAARECLELAAQDRWWDAREKFDFADYNLKYFVHLEILRQDLDEQSLGQYNRPNRPGLDLSALGMGAWHKEYSASMLGRRKKMKELVAQCRDSPRAGDELRVELDRLDGRDVRPECERMKEVASIQAEALLWSAALDTLRSSCRLPAQDDYAPIIGSFSTGLLSCELPRDGDAIRKAIDFIIDDLGRAGPPTSIPLQAAILSFANNLRRKLDNKIPVIKPYEKVKHLLPNLRSATVEGILQAMDRHAADHSQFLPIIHEAFRVQSNNGASAYYMHEACLCDYYKRSKDFWQAYLHFLEAFKSRDGRHDPLIRLELYYARRDWYRDVEQIFKRSALTKLKARLAIPPRPEPEVREEEKPKTISPPIKAPVEKESEPAHKEPEPEPEGPTADPHPAEKSPVLPSVVDRSPHSTIAPPEPSRRQRQSDQGHGGDAGDAPMSKPPTHPVERPSVPKKAIEPQPPKLLAQILGPQIISKAAPLQKATPSQKAATASESPIIASPEAEKLMMERLGSPEHLESPWVEGRFVLAVSYTKLFTRLAMDEVTATSNLPSGEGWELSDAFEQSLTGWSR